MGYREDAFRQKFADAAGHLHAESEELASLKVRENIGGHSEYHELLRALEEEAGIRSSSIEGNFQGRGYLVENSRSKLIIVEHETGLEILYVAGSVASLLSLIPLVLRAWSAIREHHDGRRPPGPIRRIETRRFDRNGALIEERDNGFDVPWAAPLSVMNTAILAAAEVIDSNIQELSATVRDLAQRLGALEKTMQKDKTA